MSSVLGPLTGETPVAVVGGGAGGLAAALALASKGIRARVFEGSTSSNEIDRGDIIHYASQRILKTWGVWPHVEALSPIPFTRFQILDGDGRRLLRLDTAQLIGPECHLTALRHPDIVRALRSAAAESPLIELRDGEPVRELKTENGRVHGVRTSQGDYDSPLTVVATGSRSKLRDQHFGQPHVRDYNRSFFNARLKAVDGYRDGGYYVLDRNGILIMVALPNDELRIGIQFVTSERADRPTEHNFAEHASRILRPLARESLQVIEGHTYRLGSLLASRWSIPGAVLLGDAAHTVHPTGGQGMNLAFKDANTLAALLADVGTTDDLDTACTTYAGTRRREVRPVHMRAHAGGILAGITSPTAVAARGNAVRVLDRIKPVKRSLFSRVIDVR